MPRAEPSRVTSNDPGQQRHLFIYRFLRAFGSQRRVPVGRHEPIGTHDVLSELIHSRTDDQRCICLALKHGKLSRTGHDISIAWEVSVSLGGNVRMTLPTRYSEGPDRAASAT